MKYVSGVAAVLAGVILITAVAAAVVLGSAPAHTESSAQAVADTTEVAVNPYQAPLEQMVDGVYEDEETLIIEVNYVDNPWFTEELEMTRQQWFRIRKAALGYDVP